MALTWQEVKHQLKHQLKTDHVARQLRQRPFVTELEQTGIIDSEEAIVIYRPKNALLLQIYWQIGDSH
ncbi:hypothetical protein KXD40_004559 [Peronospora effusa]|uniref:Uncharacterized protein n=1 Tax=Peronospora effusa TaxID=542832 RepID=A0A3M6VBK1_9STRA|nr:hypothetical protein DD238_008114 [Peronospora effusa]RQM13752.1 hypothetical protein DD237_007339 [Peronospora effusa]UIZ27807.1 hypothetical protein KXD40_004559 [Peronospora effusa]